LTATTTLWTVDDFGVAGVASIILFISGRAGRVVTPAVILQDFAAKYRIAKQLIA
jgi:hypothetical protein